MREEIILETWTGRRFNRLNSSSTPEANLQRSPTNLPVEVVEKRQQVHGQLDPALLLAVLQHVRVHDAGGVVQARSGHHRTVDVPEKRSGALMLDTFV